MSQRLEKVLSEIATRKSAASQLAQELARCGHELLTLLKACCRKKLSA